MSRSLFLINAGCDARWTWNGTLPTRLQALIEELPWHFVLAASGEDALYLPKPWPSNQPLPHEILGLPRPTLLSGPPRAQWLRTFARFTPFAWDQDAIQWLKKLGTIHPDAIPGRPSASLSEIARLNGRRFSLELESRLAAHGVDPGWQVPDPHSQAVVTSGEQALAWLAIMHQNHPSQTRIMVKGEHGQAGSANLVLNLHAEDEHAQTLHVQRLLKRCGHAVIEPWHALTTEYGLTYTLNAEGSLEKARGHFLMTTQEGKYLGVLVPPGGELPGDVMQALKQAAQVAAQALHAAGYQGPVGQDAYTYRDTHSGQDRLRPLSDLNVRLTFAAPAHALSQALHKPVAFLLLPHALAEAVKADFSLPEFSPSRRCGSLWASPMRDANGLASLRQTLVLVDEHVEALQGILARMRIFMADFQREKGDERVDE